MDAPPRRYTTYLPHADGRATASGDLRPELADVGRLVRRGVRAVVGAARAGERETLGGLLQGHLREVASDLDVVQESWPGC